VEVSALTGKNVDTLKGLIVDTLAGIPKDAAGPAVAASREAWPGLGFPFLYVDRVFSIKGSGLVVTGSLKGGTMGKDDALVLLPQREELRVRAVQCYNAASDRAAPTSRVALNLPKTKSEIGRGNCITSPGAPFSCEKELVARIHPVEEPAAEAGEAAGEKPVIRNHSEVEIALGTGHVIAQIHFMDDKRFARIQMSAPLPALWNEPFLVIRHGGSNILGSGRILWFGEVPKEDRRRFAGLLGTLPDPARAVDRLALELRYRGRVELAGGGALPPELAGETVALGRWMFHTPWLDTLVAGIKARAGEPAGVAARELEGKLRLEAESLEPVLAFLVGKGELVIANNLYFTKREGEKQELSPVARKLQADIEALGKAGFDSTHTGIEGGQKELKTLIRLGVVVPLEGGICYARSVYDALAKSVLAARSKGDRFSIPEAKERTGLSRKYMIPLLNRMEKDGLLKRYGDVRVVL
jgi:selenocysteine-specific elongation factor